MNLLLVIIKVIFDEILDKACTQKYKYGDRNFQLYFRKQVDNNLYLKY